MQYIDSDSEDIGGFPDDELDQIYNELIIARGESNSLPTTFTTTATTDINSTKTYLTEDSSVPSLTPHQIHMLEENLEEYYSRIYADQSDDYLYKCIRLKENNIFRLCCEAYRIKHNGDLPFDPSLCVKEPPKKDRKKRGMKNLEDKKISFVPNRTSLLDAALSCNNTELFHLIINLYKHSHNLHISITVLQLLQQFDQNALVLQFATTFTILPSHEGDFNVPLKIDYSYGKYGSNEVKHPSIVLYEALKNEINHNRPNSPAIAYNLILEYAAVYHHSPFFPHTASIPHELMVFPHRSESYYLSNSVKNYCLIQRCLNHQAYGILFAILRAGQVIAAPFSRHSPHEQKASVLSRIIRTPLLRLLFKLFEATPTHLLSAALCSLGISCHPDPNDVYLPTIPNLVSFLFDVLYPYQHQSQSQVQNRSPFPPLSEFLSDDGTLQPPDPSKIIISTADPIDPSLIAALVKSVMYPEAHLCATRFSISTSAMNTEYKVLELPLPYYLLRLKKDLTEAILGGISGAKKIPTLLLTFFHTYNHSPFFPYTFCIASKIKLFPNAAQRYYPTYHSSFKYGVGNSKRNSIYSDTEPLEEVMYNKNDINIDFIRFAYQNNNILAAQLLLWTIQFLERTTKITPPPQNYEVAQLTSLVSPNFLGLLFVAFQHVPYKFLDALFLLRTKVGLFNPEVFPLFTDIYFQIFDIISPLTVDNNDHDCHNDSQYIEKSLLRMNLDNIDPTPLPFPLKQCRGMKFHPTESQLDPTLLKAMVKLGHHKAVHYLVSTYTIAPDFQVGYRQLMLPQEQNISTFQHKMMRLISNQPFDVLKKNETVIPHFLPQQTIDTTEINETETELNCDDDILTYNHNNDGTTIDVHGEKLNGDILSIFEKFRIKSHHSPFFPLTAAVPQLLILASDRLRYSLSPPCELTDTVNTSKADLNTNNSGLTILHTDFLEYSLQFKKLEQIRTFVHLVKQSYNEVRGKRVDFPYSSQPLYVTKGQYDTLMNFSSIFQIKKQVISDMLGILNVTITLTGIMPGVMQRLCLFLHDVLALGCKITHNFTETLTLEQTGQLILLFERADFDITGVRAKYRAACQEISQVTCHDNNNDDNNEEYFLTPLDDIIEIPDQFDNSPIVIGSDLSSSDYAELMYINNHDDFLYKCIRVGRNDLLLSCLHAYKAVEPNHFPPFDKSTCILSPNQLSISLSSLQLTPHILHYHMGSTLANTAFFYHNPIAFLILFNEWILQPKLPQGNLLFVQQLTSNIPNSPQPQPISQQVMTPAPKNGILNFFLSIFRRRK